MTQTLFSFAINLLSLCFLSEVRIDFDECRDGKGDGTEEHDENKEAVITQLVFQPTGQHAWQHESKVGKGRTESIM